MLWLSFLGRYWVPLSLLADVCQERRERERPQPAAHIYFYVAAYQICDQNWLVFLKKDRFRLNWNTRALLRPVPSSLLLSRRPVL